MVPSKKALLLTRKCRVESWESWGVTPDGIHTAKIRDKFGIPCNARFFDMANKFPRMWDLKVMTRCKAPDGSEYIDSLESQVGPCRIGDLETFYNELRQELLANPEQIDNGWEAIAL